MRRLIWIFVLLALAVSGWMEVRRARRPSRATPLQLVLAPGSQWRHVTAQQREGFGVLFKDCLEYGTGLSVEESEAVADGAQGPRDSLVVSLALEGEEVRIHVELTRMGMRVKTLDKGAPTPREAVKSALGWMELDGRKAEDLLPRDSALFWKLASLTSWRRETPILEAIGACGAILDREPGCAEAWLARGRLTNEFVLEEVEPGSDMQTRCERDFLNALALAPGCIRAATSFARFRTDIGSHRAALDLLFGAIRQNPRGPRLYEAVAYAARNAGLLDGASLALQKRDSLLGLSRGEGGLAENTYLYCGDLDRFEAALGPGADLDQDTLRDFYRGYLRLLRNDPSGAILSFRKAAATPRGVRQFMSLARVYELGLCGRREEALAELRRLWAERIPVRVPDGEFTFKLAEAFGYLGSAVEAQEVANRAFAQGFGCTRWFEQSPFLACARGTVRWKALERHLRDRQALIETAYPVARFRF